MCSGMVINSLSTSITHCVWRVPCSHYGYYHHCGFQKSVDKLYGILIKHYIIRRKPNIGSYWLTCLENIMPYQLMTCFVYFEKACAHKHYWSSNCYPSRASAFTPGFQWGSCYSIFSFICMFCRSLFVPLSFSFLPLCCLSFFCKLTLIN